MMDTSTSGAETSTVSQNRDQISDGFIDTILKLSSENKFNEKNCWSFPIRDSLVFYQRRQDQENNMSSLIKAGSLAEACTKIYGYRVDSVYNSVKSTYLRLKESDESQTETDATLTDLVGEEEAEHAEAVQKKQKKVRKRKSDFIVKEKSTLLAPIQTNPRGNLILDSKNKRSGETNFVEGLLQNILATKDYVLQLDPATKYWDNQALPDVPTSNNIDDNIEDFLDDVIGFAMPPLDALKMTNICPSFRHFDVRLTDSSGSAIPVLSSPADAINPSEKVVFDLDEPMMDIQVDDNNRHNFNNSADNSMDADDNQGPPPDSMPCALGDHFNEHNITDADVERFIEKNGGWTDVQPNEYGAVKRYMVRMAKNTRSTDGTSSGTGIKFTDLYESYWAGPAYWKFKKARVSTQPRETGQQKRTGRKKNDAGDKEITMTDVKTLKFVPIEYKNRELDPRKVDPKNVIMPKNLNISRTIITNLTHTPWLSIYDIMGTGVQTPPSLDGGGNSPGHYPEVEREGEDFGGWQNDRDNEDHDDRASMGGGPGDDMGMDEMEHEDHLNVSHLSANLEGAPVKSEPIILPYSKINKNIDMYELKQSSKKIIAEHGKGVKKGEAKMTLQELYTELPPELSKENAEYLSLAIAFSALLHVAHEESFHLRSVKDFENVEIV